MDAHRRTAFTAVLLLDRRQQQGGGGSPITGVALSRSGQRLYLGLEDGVLEEHAIQPDAQGARASLAARKHAAKRVRRRLQRRRCACASCCGHAQWLASICRVLCEHAGDATRSCRQLWASITWPRWSAVAAAAAVPPCWCC